MNNLVVFGDSFSTHFTTNDSVVLEDSWPVLLSNKLEFNLINHSLIGACNGEIINKFFKEYDNIKDNDIVVIEMGFFNRILEQFSNTTIQLGFDNRFDEIDSKFYSRKALDLDEYIRQDLIKFEFILEYLTKRNIKFLIWCIDGVLDEKEQPYAFNQLMYSLYFKFNNNFLLFHNKLSVFDSLIEKNSQFWVNNSDKHFNKLGHEYFFLYLYDVITGTQRKELI